MKESIKYNLKAIAGLAVGGACGISFDDWVKKGVVPKWLDITITMFTCPGVMHLFSVKKPFYRYAFGGVFAASVYRYTKELLEKEESTNGVGMIGDRTFEYRPYKRYTGWDTSHLECIYAYEPALSRKVLVGTIDHNKHEIRPSHGYFYPHKYGKLMQKVASAMGYAFNNK